MSEATLPLLVEIGCEEIPARFLADAEVQFGERLQSALERERLLAARGDGQAQPQGGVTTYSTPRRLLALFSSILPRQPDAEELVTGPAVKVAFDASGKPTRAAEGFAAKHGVTSGQVIQVETPKGSHIAVRKATPGRPAAEILASMLPATIQSLTFPKSMVWESGGVRFVRPIRWVLALLGEGDSSRPVQFELAGVKSGNCTFGHRAAGSAGIPVESFADYARKLRQHFVEFDRETRRQSIRAELQVLLEDWMDIAPDSALEEWLVNSTEWPTGLRGAFDERYLRMPAEILVTVMRGHQKYFAVRDQAGRLLPHFVTVLNRDRDLSGVIRAGHERVLSARFSDAAFFWDSDQKVPLADRQAMLERVTYQDKLGEQGHYAAKILRVKAIASHLCASLEAEGRLTPEQRGHALRAVELCKCDLTTQMVQEFTELQGVVGGLYAREQGEPEPVWQAIYDHYKPVNIEDNCPQSAVGAVVSLADKLDAVMVGFSLGLEPTGSSDPFGLRRAGNAVMKLAAESLPSVDLHSTARWAAERERQNLPGPQKAALWPEVDRFFRERLAFYLQEVARLSYDGIRAVLDPGLVHHWGRPADALARGLALDRARGTEDFQALAAAAKRTRNILTKSATAEDFAPVAQLNPELFRQAEERDLYAGYQAARRELDGLEKGAAYDEAFRRLAQLRPAVDRFFDKVMVMDEDRQIRANRLRLLTELDELAFRRFANLSEIET